MFPWVIIITEINSVDALRALVEGGWGGGKKESYVYILALSTQFT